MSKLLCTLALHPVLLEQVHPALVQSLHPQPFLHAMTKRLGPCVTRHVCQLQELDCF